MTVPNYLFGTGIRLSSDARLKAYLNYLQRVTALMSTGIKGISMSAEFNSQWNSYVTCQISSGYTEMPDISGLNAWLSRTGADLSLYDEARIIVHLISDGGGMPNYTVMASIDNGLNWDYLDGVGGPYVECYPDTEPFIFRGDWVTIDPLLQTDVWLRILGKNDETIQAVRNSRVGSVHVEFRKLWVFEDPIMEYDEYISYASDNTYSPYGPPPPVPTP